ncbi:hypothetical protein [Nocardia sp. alder85J]|uniref:hypothetical protein n=1 Tax=Nocardia sp. alder85J TaxID=2862949 RepID=UPI001CD1AC55|nr:hypothetical protein [Nocardia sp. alder85J]MCX4090916.1 hypothetical protein [Nocardia sp. alder85J]
MNLSTRGMSGQARTLPSLRASKQVRGRWPRPDDLPLLPMLGIVAGGVTVLSATVALLAHTPAEATVAAPTLSIQAVPPSPPPAQPAEDPTRGVDLPFAMIDSGSCRVDAAPSGAKAVTCQTTDGKQLTATTYADTDALTYAKQQKYPNGWSADTPPFTYTTSSGKDANDKRPALRWTQDGTTTLVEVPGFPGQSEARQWFQANASKLQLQRR